jgi:hypothetical protein
MIKVFGLRRAAIQMIPAMEYLDEVDNSEKHENLIEMARRYRRRHEFQYAAIILTLRNDETHCYTDL